jgi:hypothetical protein
VRLIPRGCVPTHALFRTERQSFLGVRAFGLMSLEIRSSLVRGDRDEIVAPTPVFALSRARAYRPSTSDYESGGPEFESLRAHPKG